MAAAAAGIFATLAVVSAFHVPTVGPAWFLTPAYGWTALFAILAWSGPAMLRGDPGQHARDLATTALLVTVLASVTLPPRFWAEALGEFGQGSAVSQSLLTLAAAALGGTVMVHAPRVRPGQTYGEGVMWVMVQIGACWAIVAS